MTKTNDWNHFFGIFKVYVPLPYKKPNEAEVSYFLSHLEESLDRRADSL